MGLAMDKLYLGMGCFWSSQYLFKKHYPEVETNVGYTENGVELLEIPYSSLEQLDKYLGTFFENHSFTLTDIPEKYQSYIFYTNEGHYTNIVYAFNHFNQKIKLSGRVGESKTKIHRMGRYIPASEHNQDYLDKNPNVKCVLGFNGVYY
jgi:peptide methionine sulfoxide reductase MsrA